MATNFKTMRITKTMTPEIFVNIYSNAKFRNEVANAHKCLDGNSIFKHYKTCSYPIDYIVEIEQINIAKKVAKEQKQKAIATYSKSKSIVFTAMGGDYEEVQPDDLCNYRIRANFINANRRSFFVEFSTMRDKTKIRFDFAKDNDLEEQMNTEGERLRKKLDTIPRRGFNFPQIKKLRNDIAEMQKQPYYNYKGLERPKDIDLGLYTYTNALELINKYFDCNFDRLIIDRYHINCDEFISNSPKK